MKIMLMLMMAGVLGFKTNAFASDRYTNEAPLGDDRFMDGGMGMNDDSNLLDDIKPTKKKKKKPLLDDPIMDDGFSEQLEKPKKERKRKASDDDSLKVSKKKHKKEFFEEIKASKAKFDKACEKVDLIEDLNQQDEARSICGAKDPFASGTNDAPSEDKFKDDMPGGDRAFDDSFSSEKSSKKRARDY